ncbi:MAG: Rrf2 family transcriptional regulator [Acidimicrobiales bacterium]
MSDSVEWALHCCTVLATLPADQALPAARLAEFHEVPPAYLAKAMQALTSARITESRSGPLGGYRLARPPAEVTLLQVVLAVDGEATAFQCREIRQRGPAAAPVAKAYRRPCGIARAMWRAEDAWRAELAASTVGDLVAELLATVAPAQLVKGAEWMQAVEITRRNRT